ncbi:glycosyltransferase family 2 protein [Paenibacillus radicis (ex Gao et al. 2016)]|uniref:Glycosyl transferase n=1 Tax=Paenibacillus radicis (ex Gao et al. 2016) TaxID=1737354 RepID=A0A917M813_9BACL|nr:glycosyltransferase family 2 protein [Paenibacillus radicis (ex Gao et al. 2016)]GGG83373.1 glycosyl transferase [Paenibacillus radicis (ex Gao et al. 2016)]
MKKDEKTGLTSIIIPTYNGLPLLREAVASIRNCTTEPYELIVVDNGSTDGTIAYLQEQNINFISHPGNTGFPIACNWGLRLARGEYILLLNNDVLVSKHWLGNMLQHFRRDAAVGIVGPLSNYVSGRQQIEMTGNDVETAARLLNEHRGEYEVVKRVIGFCMLFSRDLLQRVGLLDERFSPGHFEDDDYCYRASLAGYRIVIAKDTFVFHHGSASFKQGDREALNELLARNRQLFIDKWGVDPHRFI